MRRIRGLILVRTVLTAAVIFPASFGTTRADSMPTTMPRLIRDTVPDLILGLRSPYPANRRLSAFLLGKKGKPAGVAGPHLVKLLGSEYPEVSWEASTALLKLWPYLDSAVRKALHDILKTMEGPGVDEVLWILTRLGPGVEPYRADIVKLRTIYEGNALRYLTDDLVRMAYRPEHLRPLIDMLANESWWTQTRAAEALAKAPKRLRESLVPELLKLIRSGTPDQRGAALYYASLKGVDAKPFSGELNRALDDRNVNIRLRGLYGLGKLPGLARKREKRIRALFRESRYSSEKKAALKTLYTVGKFTNEDILRATEHPDGRVRGEARVLLRNHAPPKLYLRLLESARAENTGYIRYDMGLRKRVTRRPVIHSKIVFKLASQGNCHAVHVMYRMSFYLGPESIRSATDILRNLLRRDLCERWTARVLGYIGKPGLPILREHIERKKEISNFIAWGLKLHGSEAMPLLLELTAHEEILVRRKAAQLLQFLIYHSGGEHRSVNRRALINRMRIMLRDSDAETRLYAAEVLTDLNEGDLDFTAQFRAVKALLTHTDKIIRARAIIAAGRMGETAKSLLPTILTGLEDPVTRPGTIDALHQMGKAARPALPRLLELVQREKNSRAKAELISLFAALDPGGESVVPVLIRIARGEPSPASREALEALRDLGPTARKALPFYRELLASRNVKDRIRALKNVPSLGKAGSALRSDIFKIIRRPSPGAEQGLALGAWFAMRPPGPLPAPVLRAAAGAYSLGSTDDRTQGLRILLRHPGPEILPMLLWANFDDAATTLNLRAMRRQGELAAGDASLGRIFAILARRPGARHKIRGAVVLAGAGRPEAAARLLDSARPDTAKPEAVKGFYRMKGRAMPFIYSPAKAALLMHRMMLAERKVGKKGDPISHDFIPEHWIGHHPGPPAVQKDLREWMTNPELHVASQFTAARILLHPFSAYRMAALRHILVLARKTRWNEAEITVLGNAGVDARFAVLALRRMGQRHHRRDTRAAARRAARRIEAAISGGE